MILTHIAPDRDVEARGHPRTPLEHDAPIRPLGQSGAEVRLVNLSAEGFMARIDAAIAPGCRVWLTLPGLGQVNAEVVWARNGQLGGRFAEPIDPLVAFHAAGLAQ